MITETYHFWSVLFQAFTVIVLSLTVTVFLLQLRTMRRQLDAFREGSTAQNILALVNYLQAPNVRTARKAVRAMKDDRFDQWTENNRSDVSLVCSSYDVAAIIIYRGLVPKCVIVENWGPSIRDCYQIARPLIDEMRKPENSGPRYWDDFERLYEDCRDA